MKKPRILQFTLWSLLLVFFLILFIQEAEAKTITVDDEGGQDYKIIQDAIDNATDGDTIKVYEGEYVENIVIDKSIKLIGNGSVNTTINGIGIGITVNISVDYVEVSEFLITGSGGIAYRDFAIKVYSSNNIISNCIISNNNFTSIEFYNSSFNKILNC